jgi:hypothetical protein
MRQKFIQTIKKLDDLKGHASQLAEKVAVLKGHGFTGCGKSPPWDCFERARLQSYRTSRIESTSALAAEGRISGLYRVFPQPL